MNCLRMKNIFSFLIVVLAWIGSHAQIDTTLNLTTVFTGDRRLFLRDANKINVTPQTRDSVVKMTSIFYTTIPTPKINPIEPKLIPAAKINVDEKLGYLYKGYVRAGYGSYNTTPIDLYYTDGRSKRGTFGFHYKLLRGDGVPLDDADSIPDRYSDNKAELWGKWFFNKTQLLGNFNWERNVSHFYGVDVKNDYKGPDFDSLVFNQRMNTFGGGLSFLTYQRDTGDFNYRADVTLRGTKDIRNNKETNFDILLHGRTLKDNTLYSMDFGVNYNSFKFFGPDLGKTGIFIDKTFENRNWDNAVIRFMPTASTSWRDLRAKIGAGIYIEGRGESPGHFYPLAEASYNLLDGIIVPYAGVRGSVEPTTYLSLYQQNPFVQSFPDLKNRNNKLDVYAGIGGAVSRTVSYSVGVNYFEWGNFAYFINDSIRSPKNDYYTWGNVMTVVYDDLSAINLHGELAIFSGEKWKANLRGDYYKYTLGDEVRAWHQPVTKFMANGQYTLRKKFIISMDVFYIGSRWARSLVPVKGVDPYIVTSGTTSSAEYHYKLKGFVDANFRVEYRYNKRLSAWVQFNNALAMKYQRWGAYNNQQFLAMLGAAYSF